MYEHTKSFTCFASTSDAHCRVGESTFTRQSAFPAGMPGKSRFLPRKLLFILFSLFSLGITTTPAVAGVLPNNMQCIAADETQEEKKETKEPAPEAPSDEQLEDDCD